MNFNYYIENVYGKPLVYLANELERETVQRLTGQKIITTSSREALEALGFTFTQVLVPTKWDHAETEDYFLF